MSDARINAFVDAFSHDEYREVMRPHLSRIELRAGQYLHRAGQTLERVVFPHSGFVALTREGPWALASGGNAHGVVIALLGRESIIGAVEAAAAVPATCNAEILVSGHASAMSAASFRHLLNRSDPIRWLAAQSISTLMAHLMGMAHCHARHTVEARLCRLLCEICNQSGDNRVSLVQDSLASMLGVRRTTINLAIRQLVAAGLLRSGRGNLQVLDHDGLRRHSCSCSFETNGHAAAPAFGHVSESSRTMVNA